MAIEPSGEQNPAWPLPTARSVEEYSPLLPKSSHHNVTVQPVHDEEISLDGTDKVHLSTLIWIMVGVWIGTFTAGLGECSQTPHDHVAFRTMEV